MKKKKYIPISTSEMPTVTAEVARRAFAPTMGKVRSGHTPYIVTNRGVPTMVLLGVEDYEDMLDMIDTMAEELDPEFQASLIAGKKEIEEGRGVSEEELNKILKAKMKVCQTKDTR